MRAGVVLWLSWFPVGRRLPSPGVSPPVTRFVRRHGPGGHGRRVTSVPWPAVSGRSRPNPSSCGCSCR